MSWLSAIIDFKPKAAEQTPKSLIGTIIGNLEVKREPRDPTELHASDLTKESFCAREVALWSLTGNKKKAATIDTAMAVTYDLGNAVSDLVREKWLGYRAWGDWKCQQCGAEVALAPKPALAGCGAGYHQWRYREVKFVHPLGWSGSIDVFAALENDSQALTVVEVKTITPVDFEELTGPLSEHRIRTALYLRLIADSASPHKTQIRTDRARVLYVSRAFGKKHPDYSDKILPFKEYVVERDDESIKGILDDAARVALFVKNGTIPPRLPECDQSWKPRPKSCGCLQPCFAGKYF